MTPLLANIVNGRTRAAVVGAGSVKPALLFMRKFALAALAVAALAFGAPQAANARPYGHYVGTGHHYRPGWGGWGYRAPYYGYGYGYGYGLAAGAALGWSLSYPGWPASYWSTLPYAYPPTYYPYAGAVIAVPAQPSEQIYIQQQPSTAAAAPAHPAAPGRWYYCTAPAGYYPYVTQCSRPWVAVDPGSVAPSGNNNPVGQGE